MNLIVFAISSRLSWLGARPILGAMIAHFLPNSVAPWIRGTLTAGLLLLAGTFSSQAVLLVSYTKTNIASNTDSLAPDAGSVALNMSATNIVDEVTSGTSSAAFSGSSDMYFAETTYTPAGFDEDLYVTFTVKADAGFALNLTSLDIQLGGSRNSADTLIVNAALRSSLDGYATDIDAIASHTINSGSGNVLAARDFSLTDLLFQDVTGPVTFRLYVWDNQHLGGTYLRIDDFELFGDVVPEPSAAGLAVAALGGLGLAFRRQRARR